MKIGIYKITNKINGKSYIGQSTHIERRWTEHIRGSQLTGVAIRKYGLDNFEFSVLEECAIEDLHSREAYYIEKHGTVVPYGYNIENFSHGKSQFFQHYNVEEYYDIVNDIQNSEMTFDEIAEKYKLSRRTITRINIGDRVVDLNMNFPIRPILEARPSAFCVDCGVLIEPESQRCIPCHNVFQRRAERPNKIDLAREVSTIGFEAVGRKYGLTGNAIKNWCKQYEIPHRKAELLEWYNNKVGISLEPKKEKFIPTMSREEPISVFDKNGDFIKKYDKADDMIKELSKKLNTSERNVVTGVGRVLRGQRNSYRGIIFKLEGDS